MNNLTAAEKKFVEEHQKSNKFVRTDFYCTSCNGTGMGSMFINDDKEPYKVKLIDDYWKSWKGFSLCKYCFGSGILPVPLSELR